MNKPLITKHLQLPFQFEKARLLEDLKIILSQEWIPHFNQAGYDGAWTSISFSAYIGTFALHNTLIVAHTHTQTHTPNIAY